MKKAVSRSPRETVSLRDLFLGLQGEMKSVLSESRKTIPHPGDKGDIAEARWRSMLSQYLPTRYQVKKASVVDADGQISHQIDIVIFDRQYSPFLLKEDKVLYIPAESVYAVIEVKPELNKDTLNYAGCKAESVRKLRRTSAPIPHAGGTYAPKPPFEILAGIVALDSSWNPAFGPPFDSVIRKLPFLNKIHLGCVLKKGAFEVKYDDGRPPVIETSDPDQSLIFFFLRLLSSLQRMGTVPALNISAYAKSLR